jgi:cyclopropane fatty-acyl-phospholipid synthase-like methyltransferase
VIHATPVLGRLVRRVGDRTERFRPHDVIYSADYYAHSYDSVGEQFPRTCEVIAETVCRRLAPASVLDVGCGNGELLAAFQRRGVAVLGLEYSRAGLALAHGRGVPAQRFDLETDSLAPGQGPFDVVVSTEVAEHLPESCADRYVATLCAATRRWVVLTAATPGQGGTDHVNEQPREYWIDKLRTRGLALRRDLTDEWSAAWKAAGVCVWYHANLMVFERAGTPANA